jgi:hypothetical protein
MIKSSCIRAIPLLFVWLWPIPTAQAAVRDCGDFIDGVGEAQTEKEAKKTALAGWRKSAEAFERGQAAWGVAADRCLTCKANGNGYRCHARARPCVIKNAPPKDWGAQTGREVTEFRCP